MKFMKDAALATESQACPFCAQAVDRSELVTHYRGYFSEAYEALKRDIAETLVNTKTSLGGDSVATFQRAAQIAEDRRRFWSSFCEIAELNIDLAVLANTWQEARNEIIAALESKQAASLEKTVFSEQAKIKIEAYQALATEIAALDARLQIANPTILRIKSETAAGNVIAAENELARLKATRARFTPAVEPLCTTYLEEKAAKAVTEAQKVSARQSLDTYRDTVFPAYQISINDYLRKFNAGFHIDGVVATNPAGRPSSIYHIVINNTQVRLENDRVGGPSFKNTLSAGDRNSLALAFFFASLDHDTNLANRIVIIDDAVSSLDDHREITTVQEIRRLVQRTSQVIVLSHDKAFLCQIWQHADRQNTFALGVKRDGNGSTITDWDVSADCFTEYDHRHAGLREYCDTNSGDPRNIAEDIRPVLEGFIRVAYPQHFLPGARLGQFLNICRQRIASGTPILSQADLQEMADIAEYAHKFHHETNDQWRTEIVNETQLLGFVQRTLAFVKRP